MIVVHKCEVRPDIVYMLFKHKHCIINCTTTLHQLLHHQLQQTKNLTFSIFHLEVNRIEVLEFLSTHSFNFDKIWIHLKVKKWVENIKIYSRTRFTQIEFIHIQSRSDFSINHLFVFLSRQTEANHFSVSNHENLTTWGMIEMYLIMPPSSFLPCLIFTFLKVMDLFFNMTNLHIVFPRKKMKFFQFLRAWGKFWSLNSFPIC